MNVETATHDFSHSKKTKQRAVRFSNNLSTQAVIKTIDLEQGALLINENYHQLVDEDKLYCDSINPPQPDDASTQVSAFSSKVVGHVIE